MDSNEFNALSYKTITNMLSQFRRAGSDEFGTPGQFYFKLVFYFDNAAANEKLTSNLLGCDWIKYKEMTPNDYNDKYVFSNSAYNYLMLNDELERAEKLKKFIYLLSEINSEYPWYWQSITGLDSALERKQFTDRDFKIEDERKQLSIKCLPDSYDQRIGTLLDLYRDVCFSYSLKKEIVPANLRKFDMGIYIFNTPIQNIHDEFYGSGMRGTDSYISPNSYASDQNYRTSSKYIEFHNCEIDYNSSKSAYDEMSNVDGKSMEYEIIIKYDDCYENRFNEFLMREIGDFIKTDLIETRDMIIQSEQQSDNPAHLEKLKSKKSNQTYIYSHYGYKDGFATTHPQNDKQINVYGKPYNRGPKNSGLLSQLAGAVIDDASTVVKSVFLGNMYGLSLSKMVDQVGDIMSGNIWNAAHAAEDYVEHFYRPEPESLEGRKLYEKLSESEPELTDSKLYEKSPESEPEPVGGKLYDGVTDYDHTTLTRSKLYNGITDYDHTIFTRDRLYEKSWELELEPVGGKLYDEIIDYDHTQFTRDRLWERQDILKKQQLSINKTLRNNI